MVMANERHFNIVMMADEIWKDRGQPEVYVTPPEHNFQKVFDDTKKYYSSRIGTVFIEEQGKPATVEGAKRGR
ncbi:MAG: hypothetical protein US39_C0017G0014 [Microgenomates group bacterium GW2011_GWC1_37_12b]|nr:MAG: hypothetical protein US39_C0017G0014 [Microgenomates group bacterium GW2011_GWC1_37_12b]KKQ86816.1 MAG: hypothetical protein UT10_C0016G0010 [Candidatus Woesebacteria bacterium GW2011_GWB1_38_8b]